MAKKLGKSASVEELKELERLVAANPSYGWLEEIVASLKGSPEHFERNIPAEELADSGWQHLADRLRGGASEDGYLGEESEMTVQGGGARRIWLPRLWRRMAAAVVLLVAGSGAFWYFRGDRNTIAARYADKTLKTRYGGRSKIILSDGTEVRLNAGSRLNYPDVFSGARREVTLEGEAFFDVAQHPETPFLVHAGKVTIRVLGTRFDVKAYREDAAVTTTLISGKVQVTMDGDPDKKVVLAPYEKLMVINSPREELGVRGAPGNALRYQVQDLPEIGSGSLPETAWVENRLVVSNETFGEVARMLERRYDVQIDFGDERLRQEHLSGVFEKETIRQVLDILKMTTKFKYSIDGKKVRLMPDL